MEASVTTLRGKDSDGMAYVPPLICDNIHVRGRLGEDLRQ